MKKDDNKNPSGKKTGDNLEQGLRSFVLQPDVFLSDSISRLLPDSDFFLFDHEMRFILVKEGNLLNAGLNYHGFENKKLEDIPRQELITIWEPLLRTALQGRHASREYTLWDQHFEMKAAPIAERSDKVTLGIAIVTNVSKVKNYESDLKHAKEEAERANRMKSEFLAHITHEIRTPLNSIKGFTEQLLKADLDQKQCVYLKIVDQSAEHLTSLIDDVLVLSKIEAKQIRFDSIPFKVQYTVSYVVETLQKKTENKDIRILVDIDDKLDMVLMGDEMRLRQILLNLMNNAVKFTSAGYIELKCFVKHEDEDRAHVRFDITDTGIGISQEKINEIFDEFVQADRSITKKYGGTGLGLTISKNLIELQKGSLSVTSQEGIGSTFSFTIPYRKGSVSDLISTGPEPQNAKKLRGKHVLLVDDDESNRMLGEIVLQEFECAFDSARNGAEANRMLDLRRYDIVLLDIHMPKISGFDVAAYLRQTKLNKNAHVIAVTAVAMKEDIDRFKDAGLDGYLVKPFTERELYNKMCEVLDIEDASQEKHHAEIILQEDDKPEMYNLDELKKMSGDNRVFVAKILSNFIENAENTSYLMSKFLEEEEWEQIGEAAHKLLPSIRHLEVHDVVDKLTRIHQLTLEEKKFDPVPELVETTIREIKHLVTQLKKETST